VATDAPGGCAVYFRFSIKCCNFALATNQLDINDH
jgi:hypothetical protein